MPGTALLVVPISALIARYMTAWIAGFTPRYTKALISVILAYVIAILASVFALGPNLLPFIECGVLSCSNIYLLRSDAGDRLSPGKSIIVAFCQVIGAMIALALALCIVLVLMRI